MNGISFLSDSLRKNFYELIRKHSIFKSEDYQLMFYPVSFIFEEGDIIGET